MPEQIESETFLACHLRAIFDGDHVHIIQWPSGLQFWFYLED